MISHLMLMYQIKMDERNRHNKISIRTMHFGRRQTRIAVEFQQRLAKVKHYSGSGGPPPPPPANFKGFKRKFANPPKKIKKMDKKKKNKLKEEMRAPAGGMSLMDELAKNFNNASKNEISIGDSDDEPAVEEQKAPSVPIQHTTQNMNLSEPPPPPPPIKSGAPVPTANLKPASTSSAPPPPPIGGAPSASTISHPPTTTLSSPPAPPAPFPVATPPPMSVPTAPPAPVSNFAEMAVDAKGGISVGVYSLHTQGSSSAPPPPPPPMFAPPQEEVKDEEEEVDEDEITEFLKKIRKQEESDEEDKEDHENVRAARMSIVKRSKAASIKEESTIKNSDQFLDTDHAGYTSTVWVEIINEEGDKVFLNRVTGEIALQKPDDDQAQEEYEESKEDWRWIPDKEEAWMPAQFIQRRPTGKYEYNDVEGIMFTISEKLHKKTVKFNKKSLQNYVHDLLMLDEGTEATILHNIKNRFQKKRIYTRLGKILISVNPYKLYPIYTPDVVEKYQGARNTSSLPPHIYEVAKGAIEELIKTKHPQSILIAGESGSGKTEACKQCMQYLAEVAGSESDMERKLLDCSPILESLGNAQTVRNDNSSRFGKWSEIYFDQNHKIVAGQVIDYLLEKSRVTHQEKGERNYHIFYQLCRGLTEQQKQEYKIMEVENYRYLTQSKKTKIKGVDDSQVFSETFASMEKILGKDATKSLVRILSAVLLIGNIEFIDNQDDSTSINPNSMDTIAKISSLLGIDAADFEKFLTIQSSEVAGSEMISNMTLPKAEEARHGLSRMIYQRLFQEVVRLINDSLESESATKSTKRRYIGILDIYGFEIFKNNSFEQFSINYANEKLQQHFVKYTFKTEEKVYEEDGIF